jgi:hypothetical protein
MALATLSLSFSFSHERFVVDEISAMASVDLGQMVRPMPKRCVVWGVNGDGVGKEKQEVR